jgi:hypothetical protein
MFCKGRRNYFVVILCLLKSVFFLKYSRNLNNTFIAVGSAAHYICTVQNMSIFKPYILGILIVVALLCNNKIILAQHNLSGKIYSTGDTKEILKHVSVYNKTTTDQMYCTEDGYYSIPIHSGDTVLFEILGYFPYKYFAGTINGPVNKNVLLAVQKNILAGVTVYGTTQYQRDSLEREKLFGKEVNKEQVSTFMSPVTSLYQQFSKKYKDLRKFQAQYAENEKQKFIDTKYTYELVNKVTNLQGDSAAYFMNAYPMEYNFARTSKEIDIKFWIISNYKEYLFGKNFKKVLDAKAAANTEKK